jgi:hypothetical protein
MLKRRLRQPVERLRLRPEASRDLGNRRPLMPVGPITIPGQLTLRLTPEEEPDRIDRSRTWSRISVAPSTCRSMIARALTYTVYSPSPK